MNTASLLFSNTPKPFISSAVPIILAISISAAFRTEEEEVSSSAGNTLFSSTLLISIVVLLSGAQHPFQKVPFPLRGQGDPCAGHVLPMSVAEEFGKGLGGL